MKRILKNSVKWHVNQQSPIYNLRLIVMMMTLFTVLFSCEEQKRFEIGYADDVPPDMPVYYGRYDKLNGGARIYFEAPENEDLLSIDAKYVNKQGKTHWFTASYYHDTINVYGFSDTLEQVVDLYAVDRAGNKSGVVKVTVQSLKPAYQLIADSMTVKPGFSSFYMDWKNRLNQNVNVYADFSYTQYGKTNELHLIYTSNVVEERWFVRDLDPDSLTNEPITVNLKIRVEDYYGNMTDYIDKGSITMLVDEKIPKAGWLLPETGEEVPKGGGTIMGYLDAEEGRAAFVIDDIIDDGRNMNYGYTGAHGSAGGKSANAPWNFLIDLGDYYELSRIITHQRYSQGETTSVSGQYYQEYNVGTYKMYIWNEETVQWDSIRKHDIPRIEGLSDMAYRQLGKAGDMAYMYPDDPKFTKPTRWFRYEALYTWGFTYPSEWSRAWCISEITLYGRKAEIINN
ncbi:MAG: DUF4959 domain-containing protein [Prevotellaceae bacterium]|jgi:hypothetical protein|nr:DUF4959 domain-containing protein [Prevotellaceae bacterium]